MEKGEQILEVSNMFKLLSNPLRLGILCCLAEKESMSVNEFRECFSNYSQPSISQQLQLLKANKILKDQKEGQFVYYSMNDLRILKFMKILRELYCEGEIK